MSKSVTVLVTSAGVASAVSIIKSLRMQNEYKVKVIASDADPYAAGLFLADNYCVSPLVTQENDYIDFLLSICRKYKVDALFPCFSKEILLIAEHSKLFAESHVAVFLSSAETIKLCDDKKRMVDIAEKAGLKVPKTIVDPQYAKLPIFSKMLTGSSSKGAQVVSNEFELKNILLEQDKRIFQDYIEGVEYTVDLLCDINSNLIFAGPRKRILVKSGQSVKGITVNEPRLTKYCEVLCKQLGMVGVCNAQFIKNKGEFYFIELNPRMAAGGLMLTVYAGANLPHAALKLMLGEDIKSGTLKHLSGKIMTRYWEEIIVGD